METGPFLSHRVWFSRDMRSSLNYLRPMRRHVPNALTAANLLFGFMACLSAMEGHLAIASYYIAAGALFDLLDGLVARMLGVSGEFGKQLDSLADMVTFGVAPGFIAHELILRSVFFTAGELPTTGILPYLHFFSLLIPLGAALRLARFNISTTESKDFTGMPTPANALLWASIPLALPQMDGTLLEAWFEQPWILSLISVLSLVLMTSRIPLMSMKIDRTEPGRAIWQSILILLGASLIIWLGFAAVPLIIGIYLLLSLIRTRLGPHEIQS